jgi:hypothetical protein
MQVMEAKVKLSIRMLRKRGWMEVKLNSFFLKRRYVRVKKVDWIFRGGFFSPNKLQ